MQSLHLSLHPGNILISDFGKVKIADYHLPQIAEPRHDGDPWLAYLAPEVIGRTAPASKSTDSYGFGMCLWYMLCKNLQKSKPDYRPIFLDQKSTITQVQQILVVENKRPAIP
eukprot:TRINITY_DN8995_c0_g1_i2.p1 TRINITY_DN8995_c0_g1~~TRINITY_DN8995_c0_g1_i2.p1  ORF type:complete len:113 (+),score=12.72 TRINITY_DN8995_c0_g1_i2:308-646(+)